MRSVRLGLRLRSHGKEYRRCTSTGSVAARLLIIGIGLLSLLIMVADAAKYAKICELQNSPPVTVQYDAATGQLIIADDDHTEIGFNEEEKEEGVRFLIDKGQTRERRSSIHLGKHITNDRGGSAFLRANRNQRRLIEEAGESEEPGKHIFSTLSGDRNKRTYIARSCPCDNSGKTYCLIDGISGAVPDSCGVPWSDNLATIYFNGTVDGSGTDGVIYNTQDIGCFELNSQTVFIRNAWPVVVLWYGALLIFLLATSNGKFARGYMVHVLCPRMRSNERQVDYILARDVEMRRRLREAAARAANLARVVQTQGVRIPSNGVWRREGMTEEEEREEATRWWIQQAERLGILSSIGEGQVVPERQEVEYVLRTKTFNAEKERARREHLRLMKSEAKRLDIEAVNKSHDEAQCSEAGVSSTPTKRAATDGQGQPSTPETVATMLSSTDGDDEQSMSSSSLSPEKADDTDINNPGKSDPDTSTNAESKDVPANNSQHNDDEEDTFECTICLTEVDDGERVGVLPCTHVFHVDCLKQWITRKNTCPLCQVTEIASPRPVVRAAATSEEESNANGLEGGELGVPSSESNGNSSLPGNQAEGGRNSNAETNAPQAAATTSAPWYMPAFFFPTSTDNSSGSPQRTPSSRPSRIELSTRSSSLSDSRGRSQSDQGQHRRRRRRDRRVEGSFW